MNIDTYKQIRSGGTGFIEMQRGLIAVWGTEAVKFLDGMITNDMKTLEDGQQMLAAFPNAQGRLLAVVRVLRQGDKFYFETEDATREKLFQNLFRFTYAGDFFVEDLSGEFSYFTLFGISCPPEKDRQFKYQGEEFLTFVDRREIGVFLPRTQLQEDFLESLGAVQISDDLYETLRIENGSPKYSVDMDDTTIIPELGFEDMISYTKGCYIGQEIIARIHFRGHVAKRLTGLILSEPGAVATGFLPGTEITTPEGKNAGRITSVTYSPKLDKHIALVYVRYDHLAEGTEIKSENATGLVKTLPFI